MLMYKSVRDRKWTRKEQQCADVTILCGCWVADAGTAGGGGSAAGAGYGSNGLARQGSLRMPLEQPNLIQICYILPLHLSADVDGLANLKSLEHACPNCTCCSRPECDGEIRPATLYRSQFKVQYGHRRDCQN